MKSRTLVLVGLVLVAALSRLVPHLPNCTALGALAVFGAAYFRPRWLAFAVPLAAWFLSDVALEFTYRFGLLGGWLANSRGFYSNMWVVYATITLIAALAMILQRKRSLLTTSASVLAGSLIFFVITNFAVWVGSTLYPQTAAGLVTCYTAAIPFFHYTMLGDVCFATALFGGFALLQRAYPALQPTAA